MVLTLWQRVSSLEFRRTSLMIIGLGSFLIGLYAAYLGVVLDATLIWIALATWPLLLRRGLRALMVVILIGLVLGVWRGQSVYSQLQRYDQYRDQVVRIAATIQDDPGYDKRGQTEFYATDVRIAGENYPGKIRVRSFTGATSLRRGDEVIVEGKLREGFGSYQGGISFAKISVTRENHGLLQKVRQRFFAGIYSALPEPQASLGLGFLVGLRALLPDDLLAVLTVTGLTHIVAVSGYNLTVLVRLTRRFFMRISKFTATAVSVALIVGFVAMTGLVPSIFRAVVVAGFALAAWYYGRPIRPLLLLLLSSAVTAAVNPLFLWADIGWWLSFLAFFGVLIIAPIMTLRLVGDKKVPALIQILIETTAAQVMTMPLIAAVFSQVSFIALLANVIIAPLIPVAMLLSFVAALAGAFATELSGWFAWPAGLLLESMTATIQLLARVPFASTEAQLSFGNMVAIYIMIVGITTVMWFKVRTTMSRHTLEANVVE